MAKQIYLDIPVPIYRTSVQVGLMCSQEDLHEYLRRKFKVRLCDDCFSIGPDYAGGAFSFSGKNGEWYCAWTTNLNLTCLVHELGHLATRILMHRGITFDIKSEPFMYLQEYLLAEVLLHCKVPLKDWKI